MKADPPFPFSKVAAQLFRFGPTINHAMYKAAEAARLIEALPSVRGLTLDLACGNGTFTASLRHHFSATQLIGLDRDETDLRKAVRLGTHQGYVKADARQLPFHDGAFQLIFSICALEHMQGPTHIMRELHRVLKPGGRLFFTVPSEFFIEYQWPARVLPGAIRTRWIESRKQSYSDKIVDVALPLNEWINRAISAGFRIRTADYYLNRPQALLWSTIGALESLPLAGRAARLFPKNLAFRLLQPLLLRSNDSRRGAGIVILADKPSRKRR